MKTERRRDKAADTCIPMMARSSQTITLSGGAGALNVRLHSGASYRVESIVGYDISHDVAILQASDASVPALPTQDADLVKVGDKVVAIGAPLGLESTVSEGIISALREVGGTHIIQTTTSISPGSSGGPLLNKYGKVIGLTTSQIRDGQNLNFVTSARHITELLERKHPITLSEMLAETQTATPIGVCLFCDDGPFAGRMKPELVLSDVKGPVVVEVSAEVKGSEFDDGFSH